MELIKGGIYTHDDGFIFTVIDESELEYFIAVIDEDFTSQKDAINTFHLNLNDTSDWIWFINEALRLNNRSYSVGVSKLRHLHVLILAPVILILTGIILQKS